VVTAQRPMAATKGLIVEVAGAMHVVATVDPVRIREVITNLVANALRHTPRGGTVTVTVHDGGAEAVIEVRDTGEGIPPADLERVFDRFHRDADTGGSGLGLAIVRDLAAAHGGTVDARSTGVPGEGATFLVRIPLRP
jgi:two-component system, OmpR family, sensor histidine kinase BaeS